MSSKNYPQSLYLPNKIALSTFDKLRNDPSFQNFLQRGYSLDWNQVKTEAGTLLGYLGEEIGLSTVKTRDEQQKLLESYTQDSSRAWTKYFLDLVKMGFEFHYFAMINPDSLLFQARRGKLALTPEYFEHAVQSKLTKYEDAVRTISKLPPKQTIWQLRHKAAWRNGSRFGGWGRKALAEAIRQVGLTTLQTAWSKEMYKAPILGQIKYNAKVEEEKYRLPAFGKSLYLPRGYYENIYRSIFRSVKFIDWTGVAERDLLPIDVFRFVATYDFNLPYSQVANLDNLRIAELIKYRLTSTAPAFHQELAETIPSIAYQPGNWLNVAETREQFAPPLGPYEVIPAAYQRGYNLCAYGANEEELLGYLKELDLLDAVIRYYKVKHPLALTKEQMCSYILYYLNRLREQRRLEIAR